MQHTGCNALHMYICAGGSSEKSAHTTKSRLNRITFSSFGVGVSDSCANTSKAHTDRATRSAGNSDADFCLLYACCCCCINSTFNVYPLQMFIHICWISRYSTILFSKRLQVLEYINEIFVQNPFEWMLNFLILIEKWPNQLCFDLHLNVHLFTKWPHTTKWKYWVKMVSEWLFHISSSHHQWQQCSDTFS